MSNLVAVCVLNNAFFRVELDKFHTTHPNSKPPQPKSPRVPFNLEKATKNTQATFLSTC